MAYLTDKEKRLLLSALSREKEVCKQVDKDFYREPYETKLETIVKNLERKFYHNRFEREIRAKVIDEFAERMKRLNEEGEISVAGWNRIVDNIAEQMKAGGIDG